MAISVKNLNFFYGSSQALFDINLDAQEGDTVVLLRTKWGREKYVNPYIKFIRSANFWWITYCE